MDLRYILISFDGRINRQPFWLFFIGIGVIESVLTLIFGVDNALGQLVLGLFSIVVIWPSLAVLIKRWHDRDKSGWWVLINLIPIIGVIWTWIECGFVRGTEGPNRFGTDPLATSAPAAIEQD